MVGVVVVEAPSGRHNRSRRRWRWRRAQLEYPVVSVEGQAGKMTKMETPGAQGEEVNTSSCDGRDGGSHNRLRRNYGDSREHTSNVSSRNRREKRAILTKTKSSYVDGSQTSKV